MQTDSNPDFSSCSPFSAVGDAMCDLLAYHDLLSEVTRLNNTTAFHNTSEDIAALLEANIHDMCVWVSATLN